MTNDNTVSFLEGCHNVSPGGHDAQLAAQAAYRRALAAGWRIPAGARLLEIACGQGDMSVALAEAVGERGHVTGVDIASPDYGAPETLGEATARLLTGPLGPRLSFRLETDLLDPAVTFPADAFDAVVLAHGAWYFASLAQLRATLRRVRAWAPRLHFAEWDLTPTALSQIPHLQAVLLQGLIEGYHPDSAANVRTPFSRPQLHALLAETGWRTADEFWPDTSALHDGAWEVDLALHDALPTVAEIPVPEAVRDQLRAQGDLLRALADTPDLRALPA
ncbi:MAG: methyltransferase domain-containing protein, partial [Thermomicrobiales bacterium]